MAKMTHYAHQHEAKPHKHLANLRMHASTKHEYMELLLQAHTQLFTLQTGTETLFTSSQNLMQVLLIFFMPLLKLITAQSEIYFYNENVALLSSKL